MEERGAKLRLKGVKNMRQTTLERDQEDKIEGREEKGMRERKRDSG